MGLPRITAPEANGGLALDHATEALVFAELGRFLAPVSLLSSAVANRWFAEPFDGKVALALTALEPGPIRVLDPAKRKTPGPRPSPPIPAGAPAS